MEKTIIILTSFIILNGILLLTFCLINENKRFENLNTKINIEYHEVIEEVKEEIKDEDHKEVINDDNNDVKNDNNSIHDTNKSNLEVHNTINSNVLKNDNK